MGNRSRGDDVFGQYIVENIQETDTVKQIDCGLYPENYLNKMVSYNPDLIIFLDTIERQGDRSVLLRDEEILIQNPLSVSTHILPFSSIYHFLKESSHASIWFLGIQPRSYTNFTDETQRSAQRITDIFNSLDNEKKIDIIDLYETLSTTLR